jgi:hypothetical protein
MNALTKANAASFCEVEPAELDTVAGGWCGSEVRNRFPVPPTPPDPLMNMSRFTQGIVGQQLNAMGGLVR